MRTYHFSALVFAAVAALGTATIHSTWAADPPPPAPSNGTVSFYSPNPAKPYTTSLTVSSPKKNHKPLVNAFTGAADGSTVGGAHTFPAGTTPGAIGAYYSGLLIAAGYTNPADFTVFEGTINFYGVTGLDSGTSQHCKTDGHTDPPGTPYGPVTPPIAKTLRILRPGATRSGSVTIVGFGIRWNPDDTITTSTSVSHILFLATDTASMVHEKIRAGLVGGGWGAAIGTEGQVEMTTNGHGDHIYSIYYAPDYVESETDEECDDHWIYMDQPCIAPTGLSYSPMIVTGSVGIALEPMAPTVAGGPVTSYLVSPALPPGLSLNAVTGVISGTPSMVRPPMPYTVTAENRLGSTTTILTISVN